MGAGRAHRVMGVWVMGLWVVGWQVVGGMLCVCGGVNMWVEW